MNARTVILAFCRAHVRRDFLNGAKARPELAAMLRMQEDGLV